ncbi:MAG TPA: PspA/IM30 family protein [Myxococcota bacterium]|nr:PspA/IM30 family protein [Myxococcota bacterium]HNH47225.1 PspA/IM30 family protein [Myxococcota bacterium]
MSFFDRISNLWNGFWSLWISDREKANPEAVYEAAIDERIKKHHELKKAVGGIVYLRNKVTAELEGKEKELKEVNQQLPIALESNDDEVALILLQRKNELEKAIEGLQGDKVKVEAQANDAKNALVQFKGEIDKLKRERDEMLAKKATADARIKIQESLEGLSTDADIKALEGVREHISQLQAQADVGSEIQGESLDARLKKIKEKTADSTARSQLDEMKRQLAAQKAAAEGAVKKTM